MSTHPACADCGEPIDSIFDETLCSRCEFSREWDAQLMAVAEDQAAARAAEEERLQTMVNAMFNNPSWNWRD